MTALETTHHRSPSPPVPRPNQLDYQRNRPFAILCHFGINTFYGKEWSDGRLDPVAFNPSALDCRQWAATAKQAGASHIILAAKHHDGFCLWQTETTDYSVRASPWRDGRGDVVAELARACQEVDIGLGLYLSPWDRHEPSWSTDHAEYDAFYLRQLIELCTRYGDLVEVWEVWFGGAGSDEHPYDCDAIMNVVYTHQPGAMIFNMGRPTVRWVGNEDGLAADPCWYPVDDGGQPLLIDEARDPMVRSTYLPPECDAAIRCHWFWQLDDSDTLKSVDHLLAIWYRSVGSGANLLLDVPADRERLLGFAGVLKQRFKDPYVAKIVRSKSSVTATFDRPDRPVRIDHLILREASESGQRIGRHRVVSAAGEILVDDVFAVSSQRVHAFPAIETDSLRIELDDPHAELTGVEGYLTGVETLPSLEVQPALMIGKVDAARMLPGG